MFLIKSGEAAVSLVSPLPPGLVYQCWLLLTIEVLWDTGANVRIIGDTHLQKINEVKIRLPKELFDNPDNIKREIKENCHTWVGLT